MLAKNISFVAAMYLFCMVLACFSGIKPGFFLKRTWVFIPLFSFFIAIPALFSFFSPGDTLWSFDIFGAKFIITRQGLFGAALFVLRVAASVSLTILLTLTTKSAELLKVLSVFKIPRIFIMTLGMCYRYIYLFVEVIENTFLAVKSRVGLKMHYKKGQKIVAWNMANLWQRSYQLSNQVYNAMLSRGYRGEPVVLNEFKATPGDWLWLGGVILFFIFAAGINYVIKV
jgi:cobalt/nickel transport system permease protein